MVVLVLKERLKVEAGNKERLTIYDFVDGILSALYLQGVRVMRNDEKRLHHVFHKVSQNLQQETKRYNIDLRFSIQPDEIYGTSRAVEQGLNGAFLLRLIATDSPFFREIRITMTKYLAENLLANLPGSPSMYKELARQFKEFYEN